MSATEKGRRRYYSGFMFVVIVLAIALGFITFTKDLEKGKLISPLENQATTLTLESQATTIPKASLKPIPDVTFPSAIIPLADQIAEVEAEATGTYGIAVKNLVTGETYTEKLQEPFTMASTYKIPLVITAFKEIEAGRLSKDTTIGGAPLDTAINLIITRSEESYAEILADKIGWTRVVEVARSLGMTSTYFDERFSTTPQDQLTILEKIYLGQGMSSSVQNQIYDLLKGQQINDRLPKYLPSGAIVAHKTGELEGFRHNVGIVTYGKTSYIIVLMGKYNTPEDGKEAEAKLSYVFFRHFFPEAVL